MNKIVNDENIINKELFQKYFGYIISESIIFGIYLHKPNQAQNKQNNKSGWLMMYILI